MANFIPPDNITARRPVPQPRWQNIFAGGRQSFAANPAHFSRTLNTAYIWHHAGAAVAAFLEDQINEHYLRDMNNHVLGRLTGLDIPGISNRMRAFGMNEAHIRLALTTLQNTWNEMVDDWYRYATGITNRDFFDFLRLRWLGITLEQPTINFIED